MRHWPMGAMMPGALAPTSRDFDCVCKILDTCVVLVRSIRDGLLQMTYSQDIMKRNVLGNGNNKRNLCLDGILNGFATMRRRDKHSSSIWLQLLFCFLEVWQ